MTGCASSWGGSRSAGGTAGPRCRQAPALAQQAWLRGRRHLKTVPGARRSNNPNAHHTVGGRARSVGVGHDPTGLQLAGTPSVFFDAVARLQTADAGARLAKGAAAVDWVRDAFGHLEAIAHDAGGAQVLRSAGVMPDEAVVDATKRDEFIERASRRESAREPKVRTLP